MENKPFLYVCVVKGQSEARVRAMFYLVADEDHTAAALTMAQGAQTEPKHATVCIQVSLWVYTFRRAGVGVRVGMSVVAVRVDVWEWLSVCTGVPACVWGVDVQVSSVCVWVFWRACSWGYA